MKTVISAICASLCFTTLPAIAATPAPVPVTADARPPSQPGVIRIGEHYCPVVPDSGIPEGTRKTLALVSTTCVMEASGLITHDEAEGVYQQALANIQMAMSEIPTNEVAPSLASK